MLPSRIYNLAISSLPFRLNLKNWRSSLLEAMNYCDAHFLHADEEVINSYE